MIQRKIPLIAAGLLCFFQPQFFAQGGADSEDSEDISAQFDDFDSLFDDAEDVSAPIVTEEKSPTGSYNIPIGTLKFPIEVSGDLDAELGLAFRREDGSNDATVYFDFQNYIYFTTRPDKYLALKAVVKTQMPDSDDITEAAEDGQTNYFYIYEMYFDYLMFDRIYITAGKKKSVWGNIRLFSNTDDYENDTDALYTNILYDSRIHISGIVKIPIGNHTFTAIGMYKGGGDSAGTKDMSFAASAEFVFFNTSVNFFGRRFPLTYGSNSDQHQLPILGVELKRTILGFDLYAQELTRVVSGENFLNFFKSKFEERDVFDKMISTAGVYRIWNENTPYFGFNFEFQNIYRRHRDEDTDKFTNRFALYCGVAKLGPKKDIGIGFQWNHNITDNSGFIKSGVIISSFLPHCDWRNGFEYEYGADFDSYKLTVGSYLRISLDY